MNKKQDVLTYEQPMVKVITEEDEFEEIVKDDKTGKEKKVKRKVVELINDKRLSPIINVLRSGPMTIKEIKMGYDDLAGKPKKEMTIYRYVKQLEKGGLVVQAGRRVEMNKTATEILYSRTGKIFYNIDLSKDYWGTVKSKKVLEILKGMLTIYPKFKISSDANLMDLVTKLYALINTEVAKLLEESSEKIPELFDDKTYDEVSKTINILQLFVLLSNPEIYEDEWKKIFIG
jgi:hypothetical protein